jgi:predicted RNase H-like HicB family nuclease
MARKKTRYTVSDGKMVLVLEPAEEGGFAVTSPLDPGLITQAETLEEAFEMAYDAAALLKVVRRELRRTDRRRSPIKSAEPRNSSPRRGVRA